MWFRFLPFFTLQYRHYTNAASLAVNALSLANTNLVTALANDFQNFDLDDRSEESYDSYADSVYPTIARPTEDMDVGGGERGRSSETRAVAGSDDLFLDSARPDERGDSSER